MNNDVSSILRLNGWAGRLVLGFYGVGTTIVAVLNLGGLIQPVIGILALVLFWAGIAALGLPHGEPLGLGFTLAIVGLVAVTTALMSWNVADPQNPGFATWPLGAMTFLLFVLALRGRRGYAWIGFAALTAVSVIVAVLFDLELVSVVNDVLRQSATLIIGTLFGIVLRRATQSISAIQDNQLRLATVAAAKDAATRESAVQSALLERDARSLLHRIADPAPFTQQDLAQLAALETSLREGTQPAGFSGESTSDAIRRARMRGLSVSLFDDRGAAMTAIERGRIENALQPLLADTATGSITVRLSPLGSEELATIVVEENGSYRRVLVTANSIEAATA